MDNKEYTYNILRERIMENENMIDIETLLREGGTGESYIDSIMNLYEDSHAMTLNKPLVYKRNSGDEIKMEMMNEADWRKKATMAAMIISKSLE
jgi:hypothetical protein